MGTHSEKGNRDYRKDLAAYLDTVRDQGRNYLEAALQDLRRSKHVCLFGIGKTFHPVMDTLRNHAGVQITLLSDNDPSKWGKSYPGNLICMSPHDLEAYKGQVAVVLVTQYYGEIYEQLRNSGFNPIHVLMVFRLLYGDFFKSKGNIDTIAEKTLALLEILEDEESKEVLLTLVHNWFDFSMDDAGYGGICSGHPYYPEGIISLGEQEIFVDAGAYDGDTLMEFLDRTGGKFAKIFSFELDKDNFLRLEHTVDELEASIRDKITLCPVGLADEEKEIRYEKGGGQGLNSCVIEGGRGMNVGRIARLSELLKGEAVTFMKMDIEGFEMKALRGAEEMIRRHRPKLAVCVYHRPEHLWEVPLFLKKTVPDYKLYLRHHGILEYDTVCYAVP